MEKMKVIFDTDIGDDIDDALALALALELPQIELLGVTTVFLNTDERARIARKMLKLWGRNIPVYAGIRNGEGMHHNIHNRCCQYTPDLEDPQYAPINDVFTDEGRGAVDFIVENARKYGEELTLITVGPLSNVAAAVKMDPEAMKKIRIVLMGGCFYRQFSEWNIVCDPRGAKAVINADNRVTCVGLEVTEKTILTDAQQAAIMAPGKDEKMEYLAQLVRMHYSYTGRNACLHDVLTVYYSVYPQILTTEDLLIRVETEGEFTAGMTVNMDEMFCYLSQPLPGTRTTVGKTVDAEAFLNDLFKILYDGKDAVSE